MDVTVTTLAGTSPAVTQDQFSYLAVTGISAAVRGWPARR